MAPRRTADIFDELAKLVAQGDENLILVLDRFCM
jgi:hypothetical protein